jgi:uncharacterized membrane protein
MTAPASAQQSPNDRPLREVPPAGKPPRPPEEAPRTDEAPRAEPAAAEPSPVSADAARPDAPPRIRRTATEARQGEIILGRYGRYIWIGSFVILLLMMIILMFR